MNKLLSLKDKSISLDKLQDWLDLQIAGVDICLENFTDLTQESKHYYYGKIEAFENLKRFAHELVNDK